MKRVSGSIMSIGVVFGGIFLVSWLDNQNTDAVESGQRQSLVFPEPEVSQPAPVPVKPEEFDVLPVLPMVHMGDPVEVVSFPESEPTVIQSPKNCPPTSSRKRGLFGSSRGGWSLSRR